MKSPCHPGTAAVSSLASVAAYPHDSRSDGGGFVVEGLDYRPGQGTAQVSSFHQAPEGMAGNAEGLEFPGLAVPQGVGAHAVAYGACRPPWVVSSPVGICVLPSVVVNLIPLMATLQYYIVHGKLFARSALQAHAYPLYHREERSDGRYPKEIATPCSR